MKIVVEDVGRSGAENMALDQAMLDEAAESGAATLRLYRWDPPCLSVGRNQKTQFLAAEVVRRPTGGGAVWHEHEVTYAVAAPVAIFGSLRLAYRTIHERIADALRTLGVAVTLAPDRRTAGSPTACFSMPVGGEILVNGRKLVGSAQVRKRDAFLQHGSILLDGSQDIVGGLPGDGCITLRAVLGRNITFDEVADALVQTWGGARIPLLQS